VEGRKLEGKKEKGLQGLRRRPRGPRKKGFQRVGYKSVRDEGKNRVVNMPEEVKHGRGSGGISINKARKEEQIKRGHLVNLFLHHPSPKPDARGKTMACDGLCGWEETDTVP